jgi:hypothetical protein
MSLIRSIKAQLGLSNTATNNFTLTAEAADGTMKLARGNAGATTQDIMTVDASGKVAFPQNAQTLQDVTASRAFATLYTNSTSQTIWVMVNGRATGLSALSCTVDGVVCNNISVGTSGYDASITFPVPAGKTYRADFTSASLIKWMELR